MADWQRDRLYEEIRSRLAERPDGMLPGPDEAVIGVVGGPPGRVAGQPCPWGPARQPGP